MKNDIDKQIREALRQEDAELFEDHGGEQSMLEMVFESFHGRQRWLVFLVWFWTLVMFAGSIFCAVQFFRVDTTREMIAWAMGFIFGQVAVGMLKMWYFMELNKNALTREIKRVELQIARLSKRIKE